MENFSYFITVVLCISSFVSTAIFIFIFYSLDYISDAIALLKFSKKIYPAFLSDIRNCSIDFETALHFLDNVIPAHASYKYRFSCYQEVLDIFENELSHNW